MSKALISESTLTAIADAIRAKTGKTAKLSPGAMASEIASISGGGGSAEKFGVSIDAFIGDSSGKLAAPNTPSVEFSGFTDIAADALAYRFWRRTDLKTLVFADLTNISGNRALNYMCGYCTALTSVSFPALTSITAASDAMNYAFQSCTKLESVSFPALKIIGSSTANTAKQMSYAFSGASKLLTVEFPELEEIWCTASGQGGTFYGNSAVRNWYFPKCHTITNRSTLTSSVQGLFRSCYSSAIIHFAAANQASIEASPGYSTRFGLGTNAQILFDL